MSSCCLSFCASSEWMCISWGTTVFRESPNILARFPLPSRAWSPLAFPGFKIGWFLRDPTWVNALRLQSKESVHYLPPHHVFTSHESLDCPPHVQVDNSTFPRKPRTDLTFPQSSLPISRLQWALPCLTLEIVFWQLDELSCWGIFYYWLYYWHPYIIILFLYARVLSPQLDW